jgi:hypothetical protein
MTRLQDNGWVSAQSFESAPRIPKSNPQPLRLIHGGAPL